MSEEQAPATAQVSLEDAKKAEQENRPNAICGFCKMDPLRVHIEDTRNEINGSVLVTRTIFCQGCRAVINIIVLGVERSRLDPGAFLRH